MESLDKEVFNFKKVLEQHNVPLTRNKVKVLQLNITKRCNQSCIHCHVDANPYRTETMDKKTIDRVLDMLSNNSDIHTIDITGGAPELNPNFRYLINELHFLNRKIIDRCNLTVIFEKGQEDTPEFLAKNQVQIIASLPCYLEENVDFQRGNNVYAKSIKAIKILNSLGYGKKDSGLILDLVYNPIGDNLPPEQASLELDYKLELKERFDIEFNQLLTITNMPVKRFASMLIKEGKYEAYYNQLLEKFNPQAASDIMCRELLSVGWNGKIYDCDFNQALDIPLKNQSTIWNISDFKEAGSEIAFENHCFGCTAGNGSSCKGALV